MELCVQFITIHEDLIGNHVKGTAFVDGFAPNGLSIHRDFSFESAVSQIHQLHTLHAPGLRSLWRFAGAHRSAPKVAAAAASDEILRSEGGRL